jgi:uncharacterized iron-regulated protein
MASGSKWVELIKTIFCGLLFSLSANTLAQISEPADWESKLYADHSLVGKIWDSKTNSFVSSTQLSDSILSAKYLILGEKHDNPDHHSLQLKAIEFLIDNSALNKLALEMMDSDSTSVLQQLRNTNLESLDDIKDYLNWDEAGWNWNFYGPIVQASYAADIPLAAGNITSARVGEVYGLSSLPIEFDILDAETMDQLNFDIDESHCGLLPESQFPAMVRVQQARDYAMAQSMIAPEGIGVTVLVAGNYHARQDLGVPNYLLTNHNNLSMGDIVSIGFMEVQPEEDNPESYLQRYSDVAAYDYLWFTPVISEEDYCASLRQQ